jgi:nucleotide-binding universal stress UspA family protein
MNRLRTISKKVQINNLIPLQVIPTITRSTRQLTEALLTFAGHEKGDLIVLSSHTKKGLRRWFLGSFAESLLLYSGIPVMVVTPNWKQKGSWFRRVLFPTDFSEASYLAFLDVLPLVERWGAKLEIFHKVKYELDSIAQHASSLSMTKFYTIAYKRYLESLHHKAESWQLEAKHYGINSFIQFDYSTAGNVADCIFSAARKRADVIAMAATSSAVKTKLIGSITRRVVRGAPCPVWILRPSREEKIQRPVHEQDKHAKAA